MMQLQRFYYIIINLINLLPKKIMNSHQAYPTAASNFQKQDSKLIDQQKIKTILSKKLQSKTPNPQQMVHELEDQISFQIEKTQQKIQKLRQRKDRINLIEQRQIKARSLLDQKILSKLQKSQKKKTTQQKKWLEDRLKARKFKDQLVQGRKQQIYQNQFKKRLEKFKQIKALNDPKLQTSGQQQTKKQRVSLLRHSLSQRSYFTNPIEKSKELEDLQYYKKLQLLEKRKIYEKLEPKVHIPKTIDKKELIEKLKFQSQQKFIQKLGDDLEKIEQARKKKEKQTNQKLEKIRKQAQLKEQQRGYRLQILKSDINQTQKNRKQVLNKKNQRFLTTRNKSNPSLLDRNLSYASQNRDTFGQSANGKLFGNVSKMSKTLQNLNQSISIQRAKAEDYLVKQKQKQLKKEAIDVISQVLKAEKIQILMK